MRIRPGSGLTDLENGRESAENKEGGALFMSIGSSLSGITFSGIGSGIDTESMISRLVALEGLPINRLQVQKQNLQAKQGIMTAFRGRLGAVQAAASALTSASAFQAISAASSKPDVATVTASAGAAIGTYNITVSKLAQHHKIATAAQSSPTTALNLSGRITLNGRSVAVSSSDTLTTLAQKINGASAGVTASVIDGGAGQAYLSLSSTTSGAKGKVQIADLTGTVAASLGLVSGAATIREAIDNGAASASFSSSSTDLGALFGATDLVPTTVTINGENIGLDLQNQSLQEIANAITASAAGVTAQVKSVTEAGQTRYRLEIVGGSTPTFADPDGTLAALGVLQRGYGNQLVTAQDAVFTVDDIPFTNPTNTVTTVLPGITLTLLKANLATPETTTVTLSQDGSAVKGKIKEFMNAYNAFADFVKQNSAFDKETFESGLLFGDSTVQSVDQSLAGLMFGAIPGLSTNYSNLTQLGFSFDSDGQLELDEATLDGALATNSSAVANVFRVFGEASVETLQFVSSTSKTVPTGAGSYSVVISQLATKGFTRAGVSQTAANASQETLTFNGALLGNSAYNLIIPAGNSLQATINQINNDAKLKNLVVATNDGGRLKIESKKHGANGNFTVYSDLSAASDNSGIGTTTIVGDPQRVDGVDVAGTINGEAATGNGQFLTGNVGNPKTEGLQILYNGTVTGAIGTIKFSKGIAGSFHDMIAQFTDSVSGVLTGNDQSLTAQIDSIDDSIESLRTRLVSREQELRRRFAAMELAIAQFQQQGARLAAISNGANGSNGR